MLLTNIRIEPPSDRPSPLQSWLTLGGTLAEAGAFAWGLASPFTLAMMMVRANRSLAKAMFMA
jgi:hypothetical protein